ncbi:MAG: MarR family transcriptional regulator [Chloroflexi bacterium]|nr:MarR family transcriptional regulator [Chloroflexota bacterium]
MRAESETMDRQEVLDEEIQVMEHITVRLGWISRRWLEQELEVFHLTVPQYVAMRCIDRSSQGCTMTEIAAATHQVLPTLTGIVDRLAARGLVRRERDPNDRRAQRVALTPEGRRQLEQIQERGRQWLRDLLSGLEPAERRAMISAGLQYLNGIESTVGSKIGSGNKNA